MTTVFAIHAHPDDLEILAAGTLALLARQGWSVVMASMTPGDLGSATLGREEIARVRRAEAAASAAVIGATYECLEFRDLAIFSCDDSRRRVTEALRRVRPDIVLTSSPIDYLCDHEATSALVRDACFAAPVPGYETGFPPLDAIPHLYFMDPIGGVDREDRIVVPDFLVDVGTVMDVKREMLTCHRSQREWLRKQHAMDNYLLQMEHWARERGKLAGVEFAEGFRRYKGHPYPQTPALEQLQKV